MLEYLPSASALALILPLIVLGAIWFGLLILQPFCVAIDCVLSKQLPLHKKALWIVAMVISLGLATTIYPYLVAETRFLRIVTTITYLPFLILIAVYIYFYWQYPEVRELVNTQFALLREWLG